jgi:protein tyrosine/serine phosphatase
MPGTQPASDMGMPNTSRLRGSAAAVLMTLSLAVPVAAAPGSSAASAPSVSSIRIDNFGRVDASLYRGAQPEGKDYADLKALGVKTIVNLTSDDADPNEKAMAEAAGLTYVAIPMTTHTTPTKAQLTQFLSLVNDPASAPVYVHCVGGRHRTGVMTATYRMTNAGWTAERAFNEMKQYKFGAEFLHPEFKDFVYAFRPDATTTTAAVSASTSTTTQR